MRLQILEHGHRPWQKLHLWVIRRLVGQVPGPIQMGMYRSEYFGFPFMRCAQATLRGDSEWTPHERELFASFVSSLNACRY
jgi:hypothetical protein